MTGKAAAAETPGLLPTEAVGKELDRILEAVVAVVATEGGMSMGMRKAKP